MDNHGSDGLQMPAQFDPVAVEYDFEASLRPDHDFFLRHLPAVRGAALDVGSGSGILTLELARRFDEVVGVDISSEMLAIARARRSAANLTYLRMDANDLRLDATFDYIVSRTTFHHLTDVPAVVRRLKAMLRLRCLRQPVGYTWSGPGRSSCRTCFGMDGGRPGGSCGFAHPASGSITWPQTGTSHRAGFRRCTAARCPAVRSPVSDRSWASRGRTLRHDLAQSPRVRRHHIARATPPVRETGGVAARGSARLARRASVDPPRSPNRPRRPGASPPGTGGSPGRRAARRPSPGSPWRRR